MNARRWFGRVAVGAMGATAALAVWALPAAAHEETGFAVSCDSVSATITDTGTQDLNDHPITWNVKIDDGTFQAVATSETHVGPADQDVTLATGDISSLTAGLAGQTVTVEAFASWPSEPTGGTPVFSAVVTCGVSPPPPSTAPVTSQVSPESVTRAAPSPVVAPQAVNVGPRFTG